MAASRTHPLVALPLPLPRLPQVVYPALRDVLGDLTPDHLLAEHQGAQQQQRGMRCW